VAKAGHDYVIPHIPQADKWKTIELALLNAGMASAGINNMQQQNIASDI